MHPATLSTREVLAAYREPLGIAKRRSPGILTQTETDRLVAFLELRIAEIERPVSSQKRWDVYRNNSVQTGNDVKLRQQ